MSFFAYSYLSTLIVGPFIIIRVHDGLGISEKRQLEYQADQEIIERRRREKSARLYYEYVHRKEIRRANIAYDNDRIGRMKKWDVWISRNLL